MPLQGKLADIALLRCWLRICQLGKRQYRLGRRVQGRSPCYLPNECTALAFVLFGALAEDVCGLRGILRWLAGSVAALPNGVELHASRTWHIALTGEIDLVACGGEFLLALALETCGQKPSHTARQLLESYEDLRDHYVRHWQSCRKVC